MRSPIWSSIDQLIKVSGSCWPSALPARWLRSVFRPALAGFTVMSSSSLSRPHRVSRHEPPACSRPARDSSQISRKRTRKVHFIQALGAGGKNAGKKGGAVPVGRSFGMAGFVSHNAYYAKKHSRPGVVFVGFEGL